jgi:hypothetical protein
MEIVSGRELVASLTTPSWRDRDLTYDATGRDGKPPGRSGACSLFIDPTGLPLSPLSMMGVRRRQRRRATRFCQHPRSVLTEARAWDQHSVDLTEWIARRFRRATS